MINMVVSLKKHSDNRAMNFFLPFNEWALEEENGLAETYWSTYYLQMFAAHFWISPLYLNLLFEFSIEDVLDTKKNCFLFIHSRLINIVLFVP